MVLNIIITAAVRKVIIIIVLVNMCIFIIVTIIAPSMKIIFSFLMKRNIVSSHILLWRTQWLSSISLNEANGCVFRTLQIIHIFERYCVL